MVKRRKEEEIAGVLEFKGLGSEDPEFLSWMAEHKAGKGGKIRVSQGGTGVRVMFSDKADMAVWDARAGQSGHGKKAAAKAAG